MSQNRLISNDPSEERMILDRGGPIERRIAPEVLRLECLKLAVQVCGEKNMQCAYIDYAEAFLAFIEMRSRV